MSRTETIQNKQQVVTGTTQHDLVFQTKGKVNVQIGGKFIDITKTILNNPQIPGVYPINSSDSLQNDNEFNYNIDLKEFNCVAGNFRTSELETSVSKYIINLRLVAGYPYKMNNFHINLINDGTTDSTLTIEINILSIENEVIYGFEEMPIVLNFDGAGKVRSRFLMFYYDPTIKCWFNPLY